MTHTLFYDNCEKLVKNRAYSFYLDSTGYKKSILSYSNAGATSLFTTVEDLSLWAANFENPVVGGKETTTKMSTRGILNKGDTISYAMGQDIGKYKGLKIISHGGADAGYRSFLVRFPDQKFSVNVLSNLASFDPGGMAFKIADLYLSDKEIVEVPKKEVSESNPSEAKTEVKVDPALLEAYCGKYELEPGQAATFTLDNDVLFVEAPGLEKTSLTVLSSNEFYVKAVEAKVTFMKDDSANSMKMKVNMNGQELIAKRLPDFDPATINMLDYTGEFFSPELSTSYTFVLESGKLIARHFRTGDVALNLIKPDVFSGNQWYFGHVKFVRDSSNSITGFLLTGSRSRNLKFEKKR